jgi:prophage antirepressor-like protein
MKIELWNGHEIRFVEKNGEWWAVARDVCDALGYANARDALAQHCKGVAKCYIPTEGGKQRVNIISEKDVYRLIFNSKMPEAEAFQDWVCDIIKELRASLGLTEHEAFRLMDKEHQKEAMRRLNERLHDPVKVDYIKANTIADKAISARYGFPKMLKKGAMSEVMLRDREPVLDDVVNLMALNERLNLGVSISEVIYHRYGDKAAG